MPTRNGESENVTGSKSLNGKGPEGRAGLVAAPSNVFSSPTSTQITKKAEFLMRPVWSGILLRVIPVLTFSVFLDAFGLNKNNFKINCKICILIVLALRIFLSFAFRFLKEIEISKGM